jgi:hypothetical protein
MWLALAVQTLLIDSFGDEEHFTTLPGLLGSFHLVPFPPPQLCQDFLGPSILYLFLPHNFFLFILAWVLCCVDDWQVFIINFTTTTAIFILFYLDNFLNYGVRVVVWLR